MRIDVCVAQAIHAHLDIEEVMPEIHSMPVEDLEDAIEEYVTEIHSELYEGIVDGGGQWIEMKDSFGLCAHLLKYGVEIPAHTLLKMCDCIISLSEVDSKWIIDDIYWVKMNISY